MPGALEGIRVIEAGTGIGPSYAGRLLAGLGADVIKLEPPDGDPLRREGPFPGDVPDPEKSGLFLHLNTGKRSVVGGSDELRRLLGSADVALLSGNPRELKAAGIDLAQLRDDFPDVVFANISWFGLTGPYADYAGTELVAYAVGGYAILTGAPEREPLKSYGSLIEYESGAQAAVGIMAALHARRSTGRGQLVDVSAMESATFLLGGVEQNAYFYGNVARRNGARLLGFPARYSYPSTMRPCKDGFVHAHSNNRHLDLLGALIPNPRLLDPDLLDAMMGHADEVDAIMDEWLADKTRRDIVEQAQSLRLPFTEVLEPGEVMAEPHHRERASFVTIDHPGAGPVSQPGAPMRMSATPWRNAPAPTLGQHTAEVLAEPPTRALRSRRSLPRRAGSRSPASASSTSPTPSPAPSRRSSSPTSARK